MSDNFGKLLYRNSFGGRVVIRPHMGFSENKKKIESGINLLPIF